MFGWQVVLNNYYIFTFLLQAEHDSVCVRKSFSIYKTLIQKKVKRNTNIDTTNHSSYQFSF